jgi:RNA polymerase sigma-70 factor (ECF subfamily)
VSIVDALPAPDLQRARAIARRLLGCDHLAADAVQEALLALWQQAEVPAPPTGWLLRAVVHRCRHLRRSLRRRLHHEHHAGTAHCALHQGCDNPLHVAYAHELGERLDAARAALPAGQRAVFERSERHGLDYAAIAAELGVPIGTVRSRLHRARFALEQALGPPPAHG